MRGYVSSACGKRAALALRHCLPWHCIVSPIFRGLLRKGDQLSRRCIGLGGCAHSHSRCDTASATSANIPDFRGPNGVWTLAAQGKDVVQGATPTIQAVPTAAHMSLVALQNAGILKHLISSNCDGLHVKSGILPDNITEVRLIETVLSILWSLLSVFASLAQVHCNCTREECEQCGRSFYRDYSTNARVNPVSDLRERLIY